MNRWFDIHTHLNMLEITPDLAIQQAKARGVDRIITISTNPDDIPLVMGYAEKYYPQVLATLGIHPHDAKLATDETYEFIRKHALKKEIVAIGEIGLDYYYEHSDRETQKKVFREHMKIASDLKMPVEIHTRDADHDTIEILNEFAGQVVGVLHCFTGTQELANAALKIGYNLSISGVITFKNAETLRNIIKSTPIDRLHVETDAPFLAPVPHRGKKNTPAYVVDTAHFVANLLGVTVEELSHQTCLNGFKMFPKIPN